MIAIGEHLGLERKKRSTRVDQIDARQAILERDLLRPEMLLDRDREVSPAFDRRIVGDDHHLSPGDAAQARHQTGGRGVAVVHVPSGQGRELEKRRPGVDEAVDPLSDRQLALLPVARLRLCTPALASQRQVVVQLGDQTLHRLAVGAELRIVCSDLRLDDVHRSWRGPGSATGSPAAAVGLVPARGTSPYGVHPKHLRAATLADARAVRRALRLSGQ